MLALQASKKSNHVQNLRKINCNLSKEILNKSMSLDYERGYRQSVHKLLQNKCYNKKITLKISLKDTQNWIREWRPIIS
jgi:hypothetical protein